MRTPVEHLDNEVRYFVSERDEQFESLSAARAAGDIEGVEIEYYCPYCDAPNSVAHTTPVPDGCIHKCHHCNRANEITPREENTTKQYFPGDFRDPVRRLERRRRARLVGERAPAAKNRARIAKSLLLPAAGITLSTLALGALFTIFFGVFFLFTGAVANGIGLVVAGAVAAGGAKLLSFDPDKIRNWVVQGTVTNPPTDLLDHADMVRHGRAVANDDSELYVPPMADVDEEEFERRTPDTELVTENR